MKKAIHLFFILFLLTISFLEAQTQQALLNRTKHWRFGHKAGLDFDMTTGIPSIFNGSNGVVYEGNACISDTLGNLLFYCNGDTIWNKNHQPMLNGTLLNSDKNTQIAAQIIPRPGNPNQYFVFINGCINDNCSFKLQYSVVDMTLDGGNGAVLPGQKNILVRSQTFQDMAFTKHANGTDYWLAYTEYIVPPINETQIIFIKITASGPDTTNRVISGIENPGINSGMKRFSPDGSRFAGEYRVYDFNNATAALTNSVQIPADSLFNYTSYSFEFSPDSKKIYYGLYSGGVYNCLFQQFDLTVFTQTAVANSVYNFYDSYSYYSFRGIGHMQLGPNGKIFIARTGGFSDSLHVIHNPNMIGVNSNFQFNAIALGTPCNFSLPIYPDYYFNNIQTLTDINDLNLLKYNFSVYPNPCSEKINLVHNITDNYFYTLTNHLGQIVHSSRNNQQQSNINISTLPNGLYYLHVQSSFGTTAKKVIINH